MDSPLIMRLIVFGLLSVALVSLVGVILLSCLGRHIPEILGYVITTAIGGLSALLVPTPTRKEGER